MKWPLVSRRVYEYSQSLNTALCSAIEEKDETIAELQKQISALKSIISLKSVMITPKPEEEKPKSVNNTSRIATGRSGWRTRAAILSDNTVPAPKDSARALEEKVKREGGKV